MKKQSLLKGAFVLTLASFITRILVLVNSMVQARVLGSEGIGLKMMVMPLMGLLVTLTTVGLPVAISRLVAEADAQGNGAKVKKILIVSSTITGSLSVAVVALAIFCGNAFSAYFLTDQRSYYSFMALIPIVPIVAVSGILKGYFRGMQTMNPLALSQVIEQTVRISATYLLVRWLIPLGIEYAAAGAVFSTVLGEAVSLSYLIAAFKLSHHRKFHVPNSLWRKVSKGKVIFFELLQTALPTMGNGLIFSLSKAVQPMIITKSLALAGLSSAVIAKDYGMLTGFVMPLLFFPGFINQSLGVTLVPAISEASAKDNVRLIHRRIFQALCVALSIGVPSTMLLYLFAPELMTVIYKSPQAAPLLKFIAPFFLLHYFQTPLQSALIGLGRAKTAMFNNMIAKGATLVFIYPLAAHFGLGIYGVMLALSIGVILETLLHVFAVYKLIGLYFHYAEIVKILLAGIIMGYGGKLIVTYLNYTDLQLGLTTILAIIFSVLIYLLILVYFRVIRRADIGKIPFIGRILVLLFPVRR
ncbi:stage V sporulation protein B [Desulfosporosinus sp. PR]|uniref:stage V sporulation protein B n=1 Tax=Candidatus Desulfosporosinus nitrosoreducens TaxID=3401928 RepID=UPI0027FD111D|nr:stage V sporulation protein B [Desulfosporosinus sp. PR]MDQ7095324.1 stage V sporulation protein B [Desulfosporosinus sp. PR]